MELQQILITVGIVLAIAVVILVILYFVSKRLQGRVDDQQSMINQNKMTTTILVIDKKKMKAQDSNLPKMVIEQIPFYLKFRKMPLVKAKIGPKITTLMCDERVFKLLPVKKNVKVELAGMYIVGVKGAKAPTPEEAKAARAKAKEKKKAAKAAEKAKAKAEKK